jgi:hypothetical protein
VDADQASAIVEDLHDWPAEMLYAVYERVHVVRWAALAIREEADLRELTTAEATRDWLIACILDGWHRGEILERLSRCRQMEVLSRTVPLGPRFDHVREGPALDWARNAMAGRLPHPLESLPRADVPDLSVPGPCVEENEQAERQRLEREQAEALPIAARQAQARLAVYRAAYDHVIRVRLDRVVPFVLGRVKQGDDSRGMHRRLREHEWHEATERAHQIATDHADHVKAAALALNLETLVRAREFWWNNSYDKSVPNTYADVCRPMTQAILELIEDLDFEARELVGATPVLGSHEALCILSPSRWEKAESAPWIELRDVRDAAQRIGGDDYRVAMSSEKSEGWLTAWLDNLHGAK